MNGYTYTTQQGDKGVGLIAQEVQAVEPSLVNQDSQGLLAVQYTRVVPLVMESIKELDHRTEDIETRLKNLSLSKDEVKKKPLPIKGLGTFKLVSEMNASS